MDEEVYFSLEIMEKRIEENWRIKSVDLKTVTPALRMRLALQVICDEINDIRKVLRKKI